MNVGVLVSGSGTNLQAILDAEKKGELGGARVVTVVSNVAGVKALERAAAAGVPSEVLPHKQFASREAFDDAVVAALKSRQVELVALAGFMRIITPRMLAAFPRRIINIHPALLPAFPGVHAHQQALEYGVKMSGCTVHFVDEGTDTGPIIFQGAVPVLDGDDEAALAARVLVEEHRLYPAAIRAIAEGRVEVHGRRVRVLPLTNG
jgi:phosphoribosylglycinamide formyltransferase-1